MKTLILNGSPRKNGDTMALIHELQKKLIGEVKIVHAYSDTIKPCVDCRYCFKEEGCFIKDDMQEIYDYIKECDNIIIASPLYFSELSGQLLVIASRLQTYWSAKFIRNTKPIIKDKLGGVILVGGNGKPSKAEDTADILLKLMNTEVVGRVYSLKTDDIPSCEDKAAIAEVKKLAILMNESFGLN